MNKVSKILTLACSIIWVTALTISRINAEASEEEITNWESQALDELTELGSITAPASTPAPDGDETNLMPLEQQMPAAQLPQVPAQPTIPQPSVTLPELPSLSDETESTSLSPSTMPEPPALEEPEEAEPTPTESMTTEPADFAMPDDEETAPMAEPEPTMDMSTEDDATAPAVIASQDDEEDEMAQMQEEPEKPRRYRQNRRKSFFSFRDKETEEPEMDMEMQEPMMMPAPEPIEEEMLEEEIQEELPELYEPAKPVFKAPTPKPKRLAKNYVLPVGFDTAQELVESVYASKNAFVIPAEETQVIHKAGGNPTYGEITLPALKTLFTDINLDGKSRFYSLGSGAGKEVLYVALSTPAKAIGVELSETRYKLAHDAKNDLEKQYGIHLGRRASFVNKNMLDIRNLRKATVVFLSNLCLSDTFMEQLAKKFEALKDGTIILTVGKQLPSRSYYTLVKTYHLPMTWSQSTPVYRYEVTKRGIVQQPPVALKQQVIMQPQSLQAS